MYSREISSAPESVVRNGRPAFGTYNSLPKKLDIKGLPFTFAGLPLPPVLSRLRIRARAFCTFSFGDYLGTVDFFDSKLLGISEFSLWNTKTGIKYVYRSYIGVRRKIVPSNLEHARCLNPSESRYTRLSWNHLADRFSLRVNMSGFRHRPGISLSLAGNFSGGDSAQVVCVNPAPTKKRCSATWFMTNMLKGRLEIKGTENACMNGAGKGLLFVNRAYYKFVTRGESITGAGTAGGKYISFRFVSTSMDAADSDRYNDNVLFCGNNFTPLPSVCITHPFGIEKNWVVQDFENMVDLEFIPQNSYSRKTNLIIVKNYNDTVFGFLNGTLLDSEGNKIVLSNFPAVAKRNMIRL